MTNFAAQTPWQNLPSAPPYILAEDLKCLQQHRNFSNLRLDTLPDQFVGGLNNAEVIFLALNPGFNKRDINVNLKLPTFLKANQNNRNDPYDSPFYYFGSGLEQTGGYTWWARILNPLVRAGITEATLRKKIMLIEYFPYHSQTWKNLPAIPSQKFAFALVDEAIKRQKTVVIMRSKELWFEAVSELKDYTNKMIIKNPRQPYISVGNLGEENFNTVLAKLTD